MKRIGNIYNKIYEYENLYVAYLNARKNKRYRQEVLLFTENVEENLINIQNKLIYEEYKVGIYREFYVYEPKKRLIMALPFEDRIIQWAVFQVLNPIFENSYISDSYACRVRKGTHKAVKRVQYFLRKADRTEKKYYCLKMDIAKYFYRVDHDILITMLKRKIKDKQVINLLEVIIRSEEKSFGITLNYDNPKRIYDKGMPIGNLSSQMFANLYLNELDHYAKRELGIKNYIRYMDDFLIIDEDKEKLNLILKEITIFLNEHLNLEPNNKTSIRPVKHGIEFVGFRIWSTHIKPRKSTVRNMKIRLKRLQKKYKNNEVDICSINRSVQSYIGLLKNCDSYNLKQNIFNNLVFKK